jgi:hypothetical protein
VILEIGIANKQLTADGTRVIVRFLKAFR